MRRSDQVLGYLIRELRNMATLGVAAEVIMALIDAKFEKGKLLAVRYMGDAFRQGDSFLYLPKARPFDPGSNDAWRGFVRARRVEWEARPFPELMRVRDYVSFLRFAQEEQVIVSVRGAAHESGARIGAPGVRCYEGRLLLPTQATGPHQGLLFADPSDERLRASLAQYLPELSYEALLGRLANEGLRVTGPEEGHVVEDPQGFRRHDSYRLVGAYDAKTKGPAWRGPRGEKLRAALNRHLGAELVRVGPHEEWEHRNEKSIAGPFWGPQVPVIEFGPGHVVQNYLAVDDLAFYRGDRWPELYPHHPRRPQV